VVNAINQAKSLEMISDRLTYLPILKFFGNEAQNQHIQASSNSLNVFVSKFCPMKTNLFLGAPFH
jgi:hypothetical protein